MNIVKLKIGDNSEIRTETRCGSPNIQICLYRN